MSKRWGIHIELDIETEGEELEDAEAEVLRLIPCITDENIMVIIDLDEEENIENE